ncbi:hypothetical protein SUGI_0226240 [Cryptomeria japonica]|uniref:uncharacterized protein LOC131037332 n=1 Tax=Cryptomeria japonica TaxID=3369 RepID=UPI002408A445|nr:uncharacterized protein LOC131037332 [Cryptomeria japonica]GLJ14107.1 hypothetical protein SUGI_0226240 [Cryptomeria japonica]
MPLPQQPQPSRVNILEVKLQIEKRIGHERAERYFGLFQRYLHSTKLNKVEFDKLCKPIIGAENIRLHNQFILGIFKNASQSKDPPSPALLGTSKPVKGVRKKPSSNSSSIGGEDGSLQNTLSPSVSPTAILPAPNSTAWSNGDAFPQSPRRGRSSTRDRKGRDRPSPLGPHGKTDLSAPLGAVNNEVAVKGSENGGPNSCDLYRPLRLPGAAEQPKAEINNFILHSPKRQRIKSPIPQEHVPVEVVTVEDGEEVEQVDDDDKSTIRVESPLLAPLGLPFCSVSVGAARRAPYNSPISYLTPSSSHRHEDFVSNEQLPDSETLQKKMEQRGSSEGIQNVSFNSANLLNHAVDTHLINLIKSAIDLRRARSCHEQDKLVLSKQNPCKVAHGVNGVWPGHSMPVQSTGVSMEAAQKARSHPPISLEEFKVAMELNPQQLGEDWPLQLEKICFRVAEEE